MLIGLKPSRRILHWWISACIKMVEAREKESYKQQIPDLSRTCLDAW
jgi:hypothetical protein